MSNNESGAPSLEAREVDNGSFELITHLQEQEQEEEEGGEQPQQSSLSSSPIHALLTSNLNRHGNDNGSTISSIASASVNSLSRHNTRSTRTSTDAPDNRTYRRPESNRTQRSEPSVSVSSSTTISSQGNSRKKLLGFIASDPANRSCSDCHCLLMDFTKMYCSFRDIHISDASDPTNDHANVNNLNVNSKGFVSVGSMNNGIEIELTNHLIQEKFTTLHHSQFKPAIMLESQSVLPASSVISNVHGHDHDHVNGNDSRRPASTTSNMKYRQAMRTISHAVFLCKPCAEAHKKLPLSVTIVKSITLDAWTMEQVQLVVTSKVGGNSFAKEVLERYIQQGNFNCQELRPNAHSSHQTRDIFSRAKYQVLAFLLPNGPLVMNNERNSLSVLGTPARKRAIANNNSNNNSKSHFPNRAQHTHYVEQEPPNRLVDYFCIVSPNGMLELPATSNQHNAVAADLSTYKSPLELSFQTNVTECFPSKETHGNSKLFPEHLKTFVFPQGCRPTKRQTPTLFTFTLTNQVGTKMYGAALHLYDMHLDQDQIYASIEESGYRGALPPWLAHYPPLHSHSKTHQSGNNENHNNKRKDKSKAVKLSGNDSDMFFLPKSLVVLSHYPFFDIWRRFLLQIYHISIVRAPLPIERYIANFVCEVPIPPMGKVAVKVQLTNEDVISISRPPINRLPLLNCSLRPLFACLSVSNVMVVMGCLLQETRVAICSRYWHCWGQFVKL